MKWIVPIFFLLIAASMASAMYYMMTDKGKTSNTVYSLMIRIGLSILLFVGIWIAHSMGLIESTGIRVTA